MTAAEPGVLMPARPMSSTQIADDITSRIHSGEYPPGTQLLAAQLAELYGCPVSRIRRAMTMLTARGLVEYEHGVGTFVR